MASSSALRSGIKNYERYLNVLSGTEPYVAPPLSDYDLLATEILTGSQTSVTFSSLNSTYGADYQHLQIRGTVRDTGSVQARLALQINGDTSSNYSYHSLFGRGSSVSSTAGTNATYGWLVNDTPEDTQAANCFAGFVCDILDPFETSKYPTVRTLGGFMAGDGSDVQQSIGLVSMSWRNTNAIDSLTLITVSGTAHKTGSRFSLYGLRSA